MPQQTYNRKKSIRLANHDYSTMGWYFLTINVYHGLLLFGEIADNRMVLNPAGKMVERWYAELENKFQHIKCHDYVVMPNHFHCIIEIKNNCFSTSPKDGLFMDAPLQGSPHGHPPCMDAPPQGNSYGHPYVGAHIPRDIHTGDIHPGDIHPGDTHTGVSLRGPQNFQHPGIPEIMDWFKTMTTNEYIRGVKHHHWIRFDKKLWHRSYYDHIIRNKTAYENIANYILNNPINWNKDKFNAK